MDKYLHSFDTHYEVWAGITYRFQNFNGAEGGKWISNFISHFTEHMIIYLGLQLIYVVKRGFKWWGIN